MSRDSRSFRTSRAVTIFGRYHDARPIGLRVQADGSMRLKDLVRHWGVDEGLDGDDILDVVEENMDRPGYPPRYVIRKSGSETLIQVMPSRRTQRRDEEAWRNRLAMNGSSMDEPGAPSPEERGRQRRDEDAGGSDPSASGSSVQARGPVSDDAISRQRLDADEWRIDSSATGLSMQGKRSTSLDQNLSRDRHQSSRSSLHAGQRGSQHGLREEIDHSRRSRSPASQRGAGPIVKDESDGEHQPPRRQSNGADGHRLWRWVDSVLKGGYQQYKIRLHDGWLSITDLASAVPSHLGSVSRTGLRIILRAWERDGRCILADAGDWVRGAPDPELASAEQPGASSRASTSAGRDAPTTSVEQSSASNGVLASPSFEQV